MTADRAGERDSGERRRGGSEQLSAVVVGAGIVGAACAAALAEDGARVTVLDAGIAAGGTTAAGMGHLVVMDDSAAQLAMTAYSLRLWDQLAPSLLPRCEFDPCGTLWIAEDESQLAEVRAKRSRLAAAGVRSDELDAHALAEAEPQLRRGLAGALRIPGDSVIYAPAVTMHLLQEARAHGATVREGCAVDAIVPNGVRCAGETIGADVVVNAAGAAAARLTPELPILPRKGHLVITDRVPGFCRHQLVELGYLTSAHEMTAESIAFNLQPRSTGQLLIGSSRELVGWNAAMNRPLLGRMLRRAQAFLPAIGTLTGIRAWTGFRPATPDSRPLVGRWDPTPGLWIAAGHEGLGITMALATARLIADMVRDRRPAIDASAFSPMRTMAAAAH
jgi:glycine/D-amino acid oxidase-like deaminating enzyme